METNDTDAQVRRDPIAPLVVVGVNGCGFDVYVRVKDSAGNLFKFKSTTTNDTGRAMSSMRCGDILESSLWGPHEEYSVL